MADGETSVARDTQAEALDIAYRELRKISRLGGFKKSTGQVLAVIQALVPDLEERTGPHTTLNPIQK